MSSTLHRDGTKLFSRGPERHWWLTGFKWGVYSEPEELTMDVSIECLDATMTAAFTAALAAMGYSNVQSTGDTVSFVFDRPKTPQPRDAVPQLVSVVRADDKAIVAAYDSLGLTSNDPNTVGDQAAATIGHAFAVYSAEFFARVVGNLAQQLGIAIEDAVRALANGFAMATEDAVKIIDNVGYTLAAWVQGIGNLINEALDFSSIVEISNRGGPYELVRTSMTIDHGTWAVSPPDRIAAGAVGRFWLKDPKPSVYGSGGSVTYTFGNGQNVTVSFADPTSSSNTAGTSNAIFGYYTKSGDVHGQWSQLNGNTPGGHPFYVTFVWNNGPIPPDA
jgi:hypothetical protein